MNYQEIIAVLKDKVSIEDFAYEDYSHAELGLGEIKEIEQYGGEDMGSTWYSIKHFIDHDVYIKVSGYYSSYNGTDFDDYYDDCSEVKPAQKTITVFNKI